MGKALGSIFNVITSPLSLIDRQLGNIVSGIALTAIGIATGNPALIGLGLSRLSAGFASTPKPPTTESAIKTARPPRVSAYGENRLYGAYIVYETASDGTAVDAFAVHHGEMSEVVQHYLGDDRVALTGTVVQPGDDGRYDDDAVNIYSTTGVVPGTPISALATLLPGIWTANHRGDGVVILAATFKSVKDKNFLKIYPNGVVPASIAARWQKCPDPSAPDPTDESSWTWTENSIRHLMHYKMVREGVDYAAKIAPTIEYWQAAAAVCDQPIPLKAGGTEPRYRSCVTHQHTTPHKDVTNTILSTCDGWISPRSDGALVVHAGEYAEPTLTIGPEHIVSYSWEGAGVDDDRAINQIICSYVSAEHDYTQPECDAWTDESDIAARGAILSTNLDPPVPSNGQVRRLAKRLIARTNAPNRGAVTTNVAGRIARGQRYIHLLIEDAGAVFYDGPAEIVAMQRNVGGGGVTFNWVSADPNVDAWNAATEEGEKAALGDRVILEPLDAPTIDTITIGDDGALLDITGPDRSDLTWFVHWRVVGSSSWGPDQEYPDIDDTPAVQLVIGGLPIGGEIEFEAAYQVGDGRVSPFSAPESSTVAFFGFTSGAMPLGTTFTRASNASYWNSTSALASAANNIARFDYDPDAGTLRGLLIEPTRINLAPQSTNPADAGWIVSGTAKTTGQADPAGGTTAVLYTGNGANAIHNSTAPDTAVVNGTTYTLSVMVKPGTAAFLQMQGRANAFDVANYANFSFSGSGSVTASAACTAGIEKLSGGWFRIWMSMAATASVSDTRINILLCNSGTAAKNPSFTSSETFTMWGAQIEAGSFASALIVTTTGSATRQADALSLNWGALGVPDGSITVRYTFDDASTQNVSTSVVGGLASAPTNLTRTHIRSAALL